MTSKRKGGWHTAGPERAKKLGLKVVKVADTRLAHRAIVAVARRWGVSRQRMLQWIVSGRLEAIWVEGVGRKIGWRCSSGWAIPPGVTRPERLRMTTAHRRSLARAAVASA